jgi:hypothetical protein
MWCACAGDWHRGVRHGTGVVENNETGVRYEGELRDGRPCGVGTLVCANGDVYEGEFVKGR